MSEIVIVPDSPPSSGRPRVLRSRPMPVDGRRRPGAPDLPATSKAVARLRIASIGCAAVGGLLLFVGSFVPVFSISLAVEGQPVVQGVQDVGWVPWAWSVALLGLTAAASALAGDLTRTRALWSGMAGLLVVYALSTVLRSTHMPKVGAWIWAAGGLVLILASIVSAVESAVADPPAQTRLARRRMLMKMFAVAAALALCGALFTITPVVGLLVAPLVVVGLVGVLWVIDGSR